jgi:hypothetical protein
MELDDRRRAFGRCVLFLCSIGPGQRSRPRRTITFPADDQKTVTAADDDQKRSGRVEFERSSPTNFFSLSPFSLSHFSITDIRQTVNQSVKFSLNFIKF